MAKTALITGATGGLGQALCREFARRQFNLVITARSKTKLGELAAALRRGFGVSVTAIPADLNQPNAAKNLFVEVRDGGHKIDVLVNNAGFGLGGFFFHNRLRTQEAMLRVNIAAPTRLCRMFLPAMRERGGGRIMNICSTGSFFPGPFNAVYCASKAYLLSLSEALAEELSGTGVSVTAVCPGATHTGFAHRADMETTRLFNWYVMDPRDVAHEAFVGLMAGRRVVVPGCLNRAMAAAARFLPRGTAARLSGMYQRQFKA